MLAYVLLYKIADAVYLLINVTGAEAEHHSWLVDIYLSGISTSIGILSCYCVGACC